MNWIALACSAENYVLAWSDSLSILESACASEFRAICRIYGVDDFELQQLKNGNLDFRLKFSGPRTTELVGAKKPDDLHQLSQLLQARVSLMNELQQRLAHGYKRFAEVVPWQDQAYSLKSHQAWAVLGGVRNNIGFVEDYAQEANLDLETAARMIVTKAANQEALVRKLERLRVRHQESIRQTRNKFEIAAARARMDEDAFLSMLM